MHPRQDLPLALERLIDAQSGAVSTEQARVLGVTSKVWRRITSDWAPIGRGIFIRGQVTWLAFAFASILRGGPGAVLGGAAAAHLHGLIRQAPDQLYVWARTPRTLLEWPPYRADFRRGERKGRGEPTRLPVELALLDLAAEVNEETLIEAVTRAFSERRTTAGRLLAELDARSKVAQRQLLTKLCEPSRQGIHSVLEWMFDEWVVRAHGLPLPTRQAMTPVGYVDCLYEEFRLIIELDGRGFHDSDRDFRRDNRHALAYGVLTLRFTWARIRNDPCGVAREVAQALRNAGWEGGIRACKRCRHFRSELAPVVGR